MNIKITEREKEVLRLIKYPDKMIASQLGISRRTVAAHLQRISIKFNTSGKLNILLEAINKGIITFNEIN